MSKETTVKIGIIGTGFGAKVQIPGFQRIPGVEVVGIMSTGRLEKAQQVATKFNIPNVCSTLEELLAIPGLDAVSIASPPVYHHQQTLAAFAAGKHVLCEKQMAMNAAEALEMLNASRETGLIGMIDHEFRYLPARRYATDLIKDGYLGTFYEINISMLNGSAAPSAKRPYGWLFQKSMGGGSLGARGSHYLDSLRYWFGDVSAVMADLNTFVKERPLPNSTQTKPVDVEDSFTILCRWAGGARASIQVSHVTGFGGGERIEIYGSEGTLVINQRGHLMGAKTGEHHLKVLHIPAEYSLGGPTDHPHLWPFITLATNFVNGVCAAKQAGKPLGQDIHPSFAGGYKVQQVLDAAQESMENQRWVSLPPPR